MLSDSNLNSYQNAILSSLKFRRKEKPAFETEQAKELDRLGDEERAERCDDCGRLYRAVLCCHKHRKHYEKWCCMQRFCPACHPKWAKKLLHQTRNLEQMIFGGQVYFLVVSIPCVTPTAVVMRAFVNRFCAVQRQVFGHARWGSVQGLPLIVDGRIFLQATVYAETEARTMDFETRWREASISLTRHEPQEFNGLVADVLLAPLPDSPVMRARMEMACAGIHLGRRLGMFYRVEPKTPREHSSERAMPNDGDDLVSSYTKKPQARLKGFHARTSSRPCRTCGDNGWEYVSGWLYGKDLAKLLTDSGVPFPNDPPEPIG